MKFYVAEFINENDLHEREFRIFSSLKTAQLDCCARLLEIISEAWDMSEEDEREMGRHINSLIKQNKFEEAIDCFNDYESESGYGNSYAIVEESFQSEPYKLDILDDSFFVKDEEDEEEDFFSTLH